MRCRLLERTLYTQEAWPDSHSTAGINLGSCPGPLQGSSGNPSLGLAGLGSSLPGMPACLGQPQGGRSVIWTQACYSLSFFSVGSSGNRVWLAKRILLLSKERVKLTQLSSGLQNIKINIPFHSAKKHALSQVMQLDVWFVFTPFSSIPFLILSISVHFTKV